MTKKEFSDELFEDVMDIIDIMHDLKVILCPVCSPFYGQCFDMECTTKRAEYARFIFNKKQERERI